jgi:hypothetical protein
VLKRAKTSAAHKPARSETNRAGNPRSSNSLLESTLSPIRFERGHWTSELSYRVMRKKYMPPDAPS